MKIFAVSFVIVAIFGLAIYMSGGWSAFLANLLSTQNSEESEIINLDALSGNSANANISDAITGKAKMSKQAVTQKPKCIATSNEASRNGIIINEVAWMGSNGDAKKEWIELKNISSSSVSLNGWELLDKSAKIDVRFGASTIIAPNGFRIISRGKDFSGTINNSDEILSLFDSKCNLADIVEASPSWKAGDAKTQKTAERGNDLNWHTSEAVGGTPGKESSTSFANPTSPTNPTNSSNSTNSAGLRNSTNSSNSTNSAGLTNSITTTTNAIGESKPVLYVVSPIASSSSQSQSLSAINSRILISEVMAGMKGNADYDFVELYNNSEQSALLTGFSIKKKSGSGKESSLVSEARLNGKIISAHGYLLFANDGGYTGSIKSDVVWPNSYSLAASKNGVVLYDANSKAMDSVYWDAIPDGASFVRDNWNSASFHISPSPTPQNSLSLP